MKLLVENRTGDVSRNVEEDLDKAVPLETGGGQANDPNNEQSYYP